MAPHDPPAVGGSRIGRLWSAWPASAAHAPAASPSGSPRRAATMRSSRRRAPLPRGRSAAARGRADVFDYDRARPMRGVLAKVMLAIGCRIGLSIGGLFCCCWHASTRADRAPGSLTPEQTAVIAAARAASPGRSVRATSRRCRQRESRLLTTYAWLDPRARGAPASRSQRGRRRLVDRPIAGRRSHDPRGRALMNGVGNPLSIWPAAARQRRRDGSPDPLLHGGDPAADRADLPRLHLVRLQVP